jgi:hypothetical protein
LQRLLPWFLFPEPGTPNLGTPFKQCVALKTGGPEFLDALSAKLGHFLDGCFNLSGSNGHCDVGSVFGNGLNQRADSNDLDKPVHGSSCLGERMFA